MDNGYAGRAGSRGSSDGSDLAAIREHRVKSRRGHRLAQVEAAGPAGSWPPKEKSPAVACKHTRTEGRDNSQKIKRRQTKGYGQELLGIYPWVHLADIEMKCVSAEEEITSIAAK